jgi:hypothetical protein
MCHLQRGKIFVHPHSCVLSATVDAVCCYASDNFVVLVKPVSILHLEVQNAEASVCSVKQWDTCSAAVGTRQF